MQMLASITFASPLTLLPEGKTVDLHECKGQDIEMCHIEPNFLDHHIRTANLQVFSLYHIKPIFLNLDTSTEKSQVLRLYHFELLFLDLDTSTVKLQVLRICSTSNRFP